jgi:DNA-binding Xre family transcriptional regulator
MFLEQYGTIIVKDIISKEKARAVTLTILNSIGRLLICSIGEVNESK